MSAEYITVISPVKTEVEVSVPVLFEKTYIGPDNPNFTTPGLWIQTGLGSNGDGITFWYEDGQ